MSPVRVQPGSVVAPRQLHSDSATYPVYIQRYYYFVRDGSAVTPLPVRSAYAPTPLLKGIGNSAVFFPFRPLCADKCPLLPITAVFCPIWESSALFGKVRRFLPVSAENGNVIFCLCHIWFLNIKTATNGNGYPAYS